MGYSDQILYILFYFIGKYYSLFKKVCRYILLTHFELKLLFIEKTNRQLSRRYNEVVICTKKVLIMIN